MGYHGLVYVHQKLSPIFPSKGVFHNHLKTNIMPLTEKKISYLWRGISDVISVCWLRSNMTTIEVPCPMKYGRE